MGKTSQPLKILVSQTLENAPEIKALEARGHAIYSAIGIEYDLILSELAWYMTPGLLKYLPIALKQARARKRDAKAAQEGSPGPKKISPRKARAPR